jgi:hypothetical protein
MGTKKEAVILMHSGRVLNFYGDSGTMATLEYTRMALELCHKYPNVDFLLLTTNNFEYDSFEEPSYENPENLINLSGMSFGYTKGSVVKKWKVLSQEEKSKVPDDQRPINLLYGPLAKHVDSLGYDIKGALYLNATSSRYSMTGYTKSQKGEYAIPSEMNLRYGIACTFFLNYWRDMKWMSVANDPRGLEKTLHPSDLWNTNVLTYYSQGKYTEGDLRWYDKEKDDGSLIPKPDISTEEVPLYLTNVMDSTYRDSTKELLFDIICSFSSTRTPHDLKLMIEGCKEYDGKIWGKWPKNNNTGTAPYNPGAIDYVDVQDHMNKVKYTYIPVIGSGFISAKPFEFIINGAIPFLSKDYGQSIINPFPEYLYVKDHEELIYKINELENNKEKYDDLLEELKKLLVRKDECIKDVIEILDIETEFGLCTK